MPELPTAYHRCVCGGDRFAPLTRFLNDRPQPYEEPSVNHELMCGTCGAVWYWDAYRRAWSPLPVVHPDHRTPA